MKRVFSVLALCLLAPGVRAQTAVALGVRAGLNRATYQFAERRPGTSLRYRTGLEAGVAATAGRGHFALQAAALYVRKGYAEHRPGEAPPGTNLPSGPADLAHTERLHYLTFPLALAYSPGRDGQGLQAFAGPYLGLLLGGQVYDTATAPNGFSSSEGSAIIPVYGQAPTYGPFARRFDGGLHGGLGYRCRAWLFQTGYSVGLRNVSGEPDGAARPARYNRVFHAALSYFVFGDPRH